MSNILKFEQPKEVDLLELSPEDQAALSREVKQDISRYIFEWLQKTVEEEGKDPKHLLYDHYVHKEDGVLHVTLHPEKEAHKDCEEYALLVDDEYPPTLYKAQAKRIARRYSGVIAVDVLDDFLKMYGPERTIEVIKKPIIWCTRGLCFFNFTPSTDVLELSREGIVREMRKRTRFAYNNGNWFFGWNPQEDRR